MMPVVTVEERPSGNDLTVGEGHLDLPSSGNDVMIRHDVAVGVDNDTGPGRS